VTIFGDAEEEHDNFVSQECWCHDRYTNSGPPLQKESVTIPSLSLPLLDNEFGRGRDGILQGGHKNKNFFNVYCFLQGCHNNNNNNNNNKKFALHTAFCRVATTTTNL
jgi:hypothetical protein